MLKLYKQLEVVMVKSNTDNKQSETISEISLRLKQKSAKNRKIRVRLTHPFKRPTHFTAHFMFFLLVLVSLVFSLAYLSSRGENTDLIATTKSLISDQKTYEKDFTSAGFDIENPNIILNPYKNSPLTALFIFETENEVSPTVTIKGRDEKTTISHQFEKTRKHFLPIYGLYPDTENIIHIAYEEPIEKKLDSNLSEEDKIVLKSLVKTVDREFKIKTDPLPAGLPQASVSNLDKAELNSDFYFFSPATKNKKMVAYDINGDIRWYLATPALWQNTRLNNGHLLVSTERLFSAPYYMTGLYEIDLLGKIYAEYSLPGGYHHDYFELQNGNLIVATNNFENSNDTVEDYVVELDRKTGNIVKTIDLKKILKTDDGKSENWTKQDWFHNNSVYYDRHTNSLILSGRHQDIVASIDYTTEKINWLFGDSTNWSSEYQNYFLKPVGDNFEYQWSQHAAKLTPEGYLFLFDNGNNKSKDPSSYVQAANSYSRGVLYKINAEQKTVEQIWQFGKERGSDFYSPYISDVDYLSKDHYLIHSGGIVKSDGKPSNQPAGLTDGKVTLLSDTVEIKDGKIIFEIKSPTNNFRVEKMDAYTGVDFALIDARRLGTLGVTEVSGKKQGVITDTDVDQEFLKYHKITLKNEEDRLVFSGQFKREDQVRIALYRNFNTNFYNLKISKNPLTALCVDILTEDEDQNGIMVTKYINKDGLRGNYSVYIEYNGKLYNTGKYFNAN